MLERNQTMSRFLWTHSIVLLFLVCLGACSSLPAQPPPQLQHTPGPMLVVAERTLQTSLYWVDPPAGWRIVKSTIASDPIVLVLVSPDDSMVIHIGEEPVPPFPPEEDFVSREAVVTLPNDQPVYMTGKSKRESESQFEAIFNVVQASIRLPE